ncbi:unnamed protein product [Mycena citricolor]|uniref:Uncharacterized protein n=1 Tax=Mycena citricolor TaxID=2018698 RepID=A0AAD2GVM6_9AGAR|nr:unnamed protein product [Mycena citricolor]
MSTLSSVVAELVRASMGNSVPQQVTDDDLDRHVAELILKEAKKKAERFGQDGIKAYLRSGISDSSAPRTNKRFLTSIIRSTDDHNRTILQAQAQAAQELKRERDELERRERRARAEEAVAAEKMRRSHGSRSGGSRSHRKREEKDGWDHWDGRTAERAKRKPRNWETWDGEDEDEDKKRRDEGQERKGIETTGRVGGGQGRQIIDTGTTTNTLHPSTVATALSLVIAARAAVRVGTGTKSGLVASPGIDRAAESG